MTRSIPHPDRDSSATLLAGLLLLLPFTAIAQTNGTLRDAPPGEVSVELNGAKSLLTTNPAAIAEQKLVTALLAVRKIAPSGEEVLVPSSVEAYHRPLTLQDCIDIALGESPLLEANRFDLLAATEEIRAARALTWPHLKGSVSGEIFSGESTGRFGVINAVDPNGFGLSPGANGVDLAGIYLLGASLKYPLFQDGSILGLNNGPAVAAKKAQKEALTWSERVRREEVIYRITDTFIATALAQNRQEFVDQRVSLLEKSVAIIQEQRRQEITLPSELKLAKDQLQGSRSLAGLIREQVTAGKLELAKALGLQNPSAIRLSTVLPPAPQPPRVEQLLDGPLSQHPSLQMQRATIDKAKQEYRLERYRLFPSVSLEGSALYADDFNPPGSHLYSGAITVHVPIFDFGEQNATVRAKRMKYLAERARLASVTDDVTNDIVKTYENIYALGEKMLSLQQEIGKAESDWRVAESHQQEGLTPPLESIQAQLRLIDKRDEYYGYEARRLLNYAALQKAACGAWKWIP
jgi:outer membrane protein TolC